MDTLSKMDPRENRLYSPNVYLKALSAVLFLFQ